MKCSVNTLLQSCNRFAITHINIRCLCTSLMNTRPILVQFGLLTTTAYALLALKSFIIYTRLKKNSAMKRCSKQILIIEQVACSPRRSDSDCTLICYFWAHGIANFNRKVTRFENKMYYEVSLQINSLILSMCT